MNWINIGQLYSFDAVFANIKVPPELDKNVLVNTVLDVCMFATPVYYDFDILKQKVDNFFLKNQRTFEKLTEAYLLDYEMIENYDRREERTNKYDRNRNVNGSDSSHSVQKVAPYDTESFQNDSDMTDSGTNTVAETLDDSTMETIRAHGNIGVTTSQQMLESELEIRPKLNVYEVIANMFYKEFCLFVY